MRNPQKQSGLSLTEILVVLGIIAVLMSVSIPAAKQLANSFEQSTGVRQLINAALSNARAIAVTGDREQSEPSYAGIRFQKDKDGNCYIIFIIHEPPEKTGGLENGFRAVIGRKPMKLPETVDIAGANQFTGPSVVFTKSGKLTIHNVWTRNKDGVVDDSSNDAIFNVQTRVDDGDAMFVQDTGYQLSVNSLTIANQDGKKTTEYISPYTGELVMEYREETP